MRRFAKIILWLFGGLAGLIAVALVVLALMDWNLLRETVNQRASTASGREVQIAGDLDVDLWSLTPQVHATQVVLGNAEWAGEEPMMRLGEAHVKLRLLPLFVGRIEIENLRLVQPEILLERRNGEANWDLAGDSAAETAIEATAPEDRGDFPVLKHVEVEKAVIRFRDETLRKPVEVTLDSLKVEAGGIDHPVKLTAEGSYREKHFSLEADGASFADFRASDKPYKLTLKAKVGDTQFTADGSLQEPVKFAGVDAKLDLKGESLGELFELLKLPLPESPPYALSGRLTREGERWSLEGFEGRLGKTDLSGDVAVETGGERPLLTADLQSQSFRVEDIDSFWGGDDKSAEKAPAKPEAGAPAGNDDHLLSDEPIALPKLRGMDAKVKFRGKSLSSGKLHLEDLSTELKLDDGLLTLAPLELGLAEGRIAAQLRLDTRDAVPDMAGDVTVEGLDINALLALLGEENAAAGQLQGRLKLAARGRSLRALGANANGEGALIMSGGKIENLLLELIALDLQEAAGQWLTGDNSKVDVLCLAMPTKIESGRFMAQPWILDTTDALVTISGFVDLGSEQVDVELEPHPKDFSLFNYLTSIEVKGDLSEREATTNPLEAAGKVALKAIAAPIMPLFSGEIEEDSKERSVPCDSLRRRLESAMAGGEVDVDAAVEGAAKDAGAGAPQETAAAPEKQTAEAEKPDTARIQKALRDAGFEVAVDGIMGPHTRKALRAFQEREGLEPSGTLDARTLRRLGIAGSGQ